MKKALVILVAAMALAMSVFAGTAAANNGQPVCKTTLTSAGYYKTVVVTPAYYSKRLVRRAHWLLRHGRKVKWSRRYHKPAYAKRRGFVWVKATYKQVYHPAVTNQVWVPPVYTTDCLPVWAPPVGYAMWMGAGSYEAPGYPGYNQGIGEQDTPRSSGGCTFDASGLSDAQTALAQAIALGNTQDIKNAEDWLHNGPFEVGCWGVNIDTQMGCTQGLFVTVNDYGADGSYVDYGIEEVPVISSDTIAHITAPIFNSPAYWTQGDAGPVGSWQAVKIDCFNF